MKCALIFVMGRHLVVDALAIDRIGKMAEEEKEQKNPEVNTPGASSSENDAPQIPSAEDNASRIPSDSELFVVKVNEEVSQEDIFVGDEDFYKSLETSAPTPTTAAKRPHSLSKHPRI